MSIEKDLQVKMKTEILARRSVPLYLQLEQIIKSRVLKGEFLPGDKIPTEKELCETYQVSTITVRQAILNLVKEGLLYRRQGKGTFISDVETKNLKKIQFAGNIDGFIKNGLKLSKIEVLSIEKTIPPSKISRALSIPSDMEIVEIIRRRDTDDVPIAYLKSYLPLEIGKKIKKKDLKCQSMLQVLRNKLAIQVSTGTHNIEAVAADYDVSNVLALEMFSPVLYAELHMFTKEKQPIEFTQAFFRPDRFIYSIEVNMNEYS
jgi:GntR family transcriptional regulator